LAASWFWFSSISMRGERFREPARLLFIRAQQTFAVIFFGRWEIRGGENRLLAVPIRAGRGSFGARLRACNKIAGRPFRLFKPTDRDRPGRSEPAHPVEAGGVRPAVSR